MRQTHRGRIQVAALSRQASDRHRGIQIGPRIRIGGTVGKIGQSVKIGVGKVNSAIAPFVSAVNPAVGAMLAASGKVLDTSNGGSSLGDIALSAGKNYVGGKIANVAGGAVRKLGASAVGALTGGGAPDAPTGLPNLDGLTIDDQGNIVSSGGGSMIDDPFNLGNSPGGGVAQQGGGWQDTVRKLGSSVLGGQGGQGGGLNLGDLATGGLAAYQAYNAAKASQRAGSLEDKALNLAESRWADSAPLRTAGQARLLNPTRPDLSNVYTDTTNPFAVRKLRSA